MCIRCLGARVRRLCQCVNTRSAIETLDAQTASAHDAREAPDAVTSQVNQLVVNAVKGNPAHGEESDLYQTMGYVRKSARKTGLTRKNSAAAQAATMAKK